MPSVRASAAAVAINGMMFVSGGRRVQLYEEDGNSRLDTAERYDPISDTWTSIASMTSRRSGHAGVAIDGIMYVSGGAVSTMNYLDTAEQYDPTTDTWTSIGSMTTHRYGPAAAAL
jgi:kelch-like protein 17 (actinfilin)